MGWSGIAYPREQYYTHRFVPCKIEGPPRMARDADLSPRPVLLNYRFGRPAAGLQDQVVSRQICRIARPSRAAFVRRRLHGNLLRLHQFYCNGTTARRANAKAIPKARISGSSGDRARPCNDLLRGGCFRRELHRPLIYPACRRYQGPVRWLLAGPSRAQWVHDRALTETTAATVIFCPHQPRTYFASLPPRRELSSSAPEAGSSKSHTGPGCHRA